MMFITFSVSTTCFPGQLEYWTPAVEMGGVLRFEQTSTFSCLNLKAMSVIGTEIWTGI